MSASAQLEAPPRQTAASATGPVILTVMEPFSLHAIARRWADLEAFFNPDGAFSEVHVVSMADDYDYEDRSFGSVRVHPVRNVVNGRGLGVINNLLVMKRARRVIRSLLAEKPVELMVQTYGGPLKYGIPTVQEARRAGIPSSITLHSDYPAAMRFTYSPPMRFAAALAWRYLFRHATSVRAVSRHAAAFPVDLDTPADRVATEQKLHRNGQPREVSMPIPLY